MNFEFKISASMSFCSLGNIYSRANCRYSYDCRCRLRESEIVRNQKVERPSQGCAVASASKVIIGCENDTYKQIRHVFWTLCLNMCNDYLTQAGDSVLNFPHLHFKDVLSFLLNISNIMS